MLKEIAVNLGIDFAAWRAKRGDYPLTPIGEKHYKTFINGLKKGIPMNISEHMGILDGYDYTTHVTNAEFLEGLNPDKACLILANHEVELPLTGDSGIFPIGFHVKQKSEKEIRWAYGTRYSPNQAGKAAYEKSLNFILVERKKTQYQGGATLFRAIGKDFVGLYPEGGKSDKLLQGKWEAGRVIAMAALKGVDIICASTSLNGKVFNVTFQKLDNQKVLELWRQIGVGQDPKQVKLAAAQNVVDYAMNTIAQGLPEEKRGYYQNPEQFLARI